MKILLIDDNANRGWKQVLEKVLPVEGLVINTAVTYNEAIVKIQESYDFIFLDIRITEEDHYRNKISDYTGYKILTEIKKDFVSVNFSTPIILLTASNKIWNIDAFRNFGVDAYYIKEHPDFIYDKERSKQNLKNLQLNFERLLVVGEKRRIVWKYSQKIINQISGHYYFQGEKKFVNVKNRIIDKLKLGYTYLFKDQLDIEKDMLKTNNEALAFIIYWSILEEITKAFTEISTWNYDYSRKINWKFRNKEYFFEVIKDKIIINFYWYKNKHISKSIEYELGSVNDKYSNNKIVNLSDQIYSLLSAYKKSDEEFNSLATHFKDLNNYRNEIDYIHSVLRNIFEKDLIVDEQLKETFKKNKEMLSFINKLVELP